MSGLERIKAVGATLAIALVVAAVIIAVSSMVLPPRHLSTSPTAASGTVITSNIYDSPACSGSTALLYPGVTRCIVFSAQNSLNVPITVQSITMALDTTFPAPPAGCTSADIDFPTFSGSFTVPAHGSANSPGLPISLIDTNTNQDACQGATLHFVYTSSAQYTDSTTTVLTISPNPTVAGQPTTFTAHVTANNASEDPTGPTGTVNFYACSNAACTNPTLLGTGTLGTNGLASFTTSSLPAGDSYFEAIYQGSGSDFSSSTSAVLASTVTPAGSTSTTTPATTVTTTPAATTAVAFTGADLAAIVGAAFALLLLGTGIVLFTRRRRAEDQS